MKLIKRAILCFIILMSVTTAMANDSQYYTSGSFLFPKKSTNISVSKEILTITIGKGKYATVDVYYEFLNNEAAQTVLMGFECDLPSENADDKDRNRSVGHPYIKDFTVTMNNRPLKYTCGNVKSKSKSDADGDPFDVYAYSFKADFQPGKNIVHHTYRYHMSDNVLYPYQIPYWLTPATRWANHKIDDFTLRIKNEREKASEICMCDSLFESAPFYLAGGMNENIYQFYQVEGDDSIHYVMCDLAGDATLEWHAKDFSPKSDMEISLIDNCIGNIPIEGGFSANMVVDKNGEPDGRYIGQSSTHYLILASDYGWVDKAGHSVKEFDAENGQGYIYPSDDAGKQINVREKPTAKSPVVTKIINDPGYIDGYPCLGMEKGVEKDDYYSWLKVKVNDKVGYIRYDLVKWSPVSY